LLYIKLKDIAEKANVSINTVSRALKGKSDISKKTTIKIREIAKELGYIHHAAASSLRSRTSTTIGVVITYLDNSFFSRILQGINDSISKYGYTTITLGSNEDPVKEKNILKILTEYRVSGMIIVPSKDIEREIGYNSIKVPHINIVRRGSLNTENYFITDSYRSGSLVAEHFLKSGRKKPGYLGFNLPVSCNRDRLSGYKDTLMKGGLYFDDNNIRLCQSSTKESYLTMNNWLKERPGIDCIFIYNDQMAFGVLRALFDLGIKVPDDITIAGHDDIEIAKYYIPALSTIKIPKYRLGYESASYLIDLIQDKHKNVEQKVVYEPELIIRES